MSNRLTRSRRRRRIRQWIAAFLVIAIATVLGFWWHSPHTPDDAKPTLRELRLDELTKKGGRLYAPGDTKPFEGRLYGNFPTTERFPTSIRKLEIEIHDGKAHGRSVGYFENGRLEVEEFFVEGISHGLRTRWSLEGWKKSEERIRHGKLDGPHTEWHANGNKAMDMTLIDGRPEGLAEAWYPDGKPKSRSRFAAGKMTEREFFPIGATPETSDGSR